MLPVSVNNDKNSPIYLAHYKGKAYTWKQAFKVKAKAGFEVVDNSESIIATLIDKLNGKAADESGSLLLLHCIISF